MKLRPLLLVTTLFLFMAANAQADLTTYLQEINACAQGNPVAYQAEIQERFAISDTEYERILRSVANPAEVAIVLWLGEQCGQGPEVVLETRQSNQQTAWETTAAQLGISPTSDAYYALHDGELGWYPIGAARYGSLIEGDHFEISQY